MPNAIARHRPASARWRRLRLLRRSPFTATMAIVLAIIALTALVVPPFIADAAEQQNLALRFVEPFSLDHGIAYLLGADALGRPMLLQLVMGARTSLMIAVSAVVLAGLIGYAIGMFSAYVGGWVDAALMRIADIIHTVPSLLLALAILYVLQPSVTNLILVLVFTRTPMYMRVARARTLEVREGVFVEAARAIGSRRSRIILHDIRPLVTPTILTVAMLEIATVILTAAGLSFLGIGLQRPDVDWGMMVADGRGYLSSAWWVTVFPGVAVVITALAANVLSNWLRAIEDPTQSHLFAKPLPAEAPAPTSSANLGSLS
ncbi:MAG TPA: ABC transporter permease [Pseudolysinimonas sp.]|nr:ABC transporter permease [Pseudolysinimonas sp.]